MLANQSQRRHHLHHPTILPHPRRQTSYRSDMVQRPSSILVRPRSQSRNSLRLNTRFKTSSREDYADIRHALRHVEEITWPVKLDARFAKQWLPAPEE